jgi:16S rRNA (cytosine1402-N4)-methyltransferase
MKHITVLLNEAIEALQIKPNGIYVDGTLGGGGHSQAILEKLKDGFLYAFDLDDYAISKSKQKLSNYQNFELIKSNFRNMKRELNDRGIHKIDGILLDLGLSSFQIDDEQRGFTYLKDTNLDMRMDQSAFVSAAHVLNHEDLDSLANIFYRYGEEKNSYKIAKMIINRRPITKTSELVQITDIVNKGQKGHSAKRVFQALRIAVNDELKSLEDLLNDSLDLLKPSARIVIITFHSLEDRIVKHFFKTHGTVDVPKNLPILNLPTPKLEIITKKPIYPSEQELTYNPRSHSAKLRVAERTIT